jgi:uncharacterized protein
VRSTINPDAAMTFRPPGTPIEGVFTIAGEPFVVAPLTVVWDRPDRIAHSIAQGMRYLKRRRVDGSPVPRVVGFDELARMETRLAFSEWREPVLIVTDPVAANAIRHRWHPVSWEFQGWYVNLQAPLTRTPLGFETEDHFLDILVRPDRSWSWKDEDELELAVERGRVTAAKAEAIRAEGDRIVTRIEAGEFPFDGSLVDWRPDPAWGVPELRAEWREAP